MCSDIGTLNTPLIWKQEEEFYSERALPPIISQLL